MPEEHDYMKLIDLADLAAFKGDADDAYAEGSPSHAARRAAAVPYSHVSSSSEPTLFAASVDGIDSLYDGVMVMLANGAVDSVDGYRLDVNGLGAKPVVSNVAGASPEAVSFPVGSAMLFAYDSAKVAGGCWICYRGYDPATSVTDYSELTGKPSIEGVVLVDDKLFPELGIFIDPDSEYPQSDEYAMTSIEITNMWNAIIS